MNKFRSSSVVLVILVALFCPGLALAQIDRAKTYTGNISGADAFFRISSDGSKLFLDLISNPNDVG